MAPREVVVLGAGVIGLQTALTLQSAGYTVSVVASQVAGDEAPYYTSAWAGAIWRTHASADSAEQCEWDTETYRHWEAVVAAEASSSRSGESGLKLIPAIQYWDVVVPEIAQGVPAVWWGRVVRDFAELGAAQLPAGVVAGATYETFAVDVARYLAYLQARVEAGGGRVVRAAVDADGGMQGVARRALAKAGAPADAVLVNATGLAAAWLVPDPAVRPVQGQTLLVRGEAERHVCRLGSQILDVNVTIPRPGSGMTVIGSSRSPDTWATEPDDETVRWLVRGGKPLAPELLGPDGEFDVVRTIAGLRPYRTGGPRVEVERLANGQVVIHEYGHAGAGYQNSVGSANKVLRLLQSLDS